MWEYLRWNSGNSSGDQKENGKNEDPDRHGYTFNSEVNEMLSKFEQMRYDRVLAKKGNSWNPTNIELVGTKQIFPDLKTDTGCPLFPSDHFGIVTEFVPNNPNQSSVVEAPTSTAVPAPTITTTSPTEPM